MNKKTLKKTEQKSNEKSEKKSNNRLEDLIKQFDGFVEYKSDDFSKNKNLYDVKDKAVQTAYQLCVNNITSTCDKFLLFQKISIYDHDIIYELLSRWRDGLRYTKDEQQAETIQLLRMIIKNTFMK